MPFFTDEVMQRIRYLHYKIKKIEEALDKEEETFNLDDLNLILEYTKTLNINYQTEDQLRILHDLDITPTFVEPLDNSKEIQIRDLMFECARALWVMARAYSHISEKFEEEEDWEDSIIAMVECSKIFKTGAYFSAASTSQHEIGSTLSSENLELNSEEARILAQSIAALKEENTNNIYFASKLYAGLSSLSKRLFYLKKHEEKKKQQLRAQFHFDMGKACQLKAQASLESSITNINKDKVLKLQQKANFYYQKSEEIWNEMITNISDLSNEERDNIELNLSVVKDVMKEFNFEPLSYDDIKRIQDPEPIIIIPENLAPFVPKSTIYLTKFVPKDLNIKRFKSFQKKKIEQKIPYSKRERLIDKKAGIVRTINELKVLKENKELDVEKYAELMEKYSTKLQMIETAIEKLAHSTMQ
jgi:hypothetical protein